MGRWFSNAAGGEDSKSDDTVPEMARNAAVFVEVCKLEARADWCQHAREREEMTLEKLKKSLATVGFIHDDRHDMEKEKRRGHSH